MKIKHMELNANNDTAPVDSIALNTPDGVKYLSGESGELQFGGEAIGGGGGASLQIVTVVDMETMTVSHSASEIISILQTEPVFLTVMGQWMLLMNNNGIVKGSATFIEDGYVNVIEITVNEDKTCDFNTVDVPTA